MYIQRGWTFFTSGVRQRKNSLAWDMVVTKNASRATKRSIEVLEDGFVLLLNPEVWILSLALFTPA